MQKTLISFPILMLVSLLIGCTSPPAGRAKTLEDHRMPTDEPDPSALTEMAQSVIESRIPPADCPVTMPQDISFSAPAPYSPAAPWDGFFWVGSDQLWTALPTDAVWSSLPQNPDGYTQKIMWWSDLFNLKYELEPALVVTGRRLDAEAPPLRFYGATNASASDIGEAMLTGVEIPTLGCWRITGEYKKAGLTFVVWVAP